MTGRVALLLLLAGLAAVNAARQPGFEEWQAVQESLSSVHPRMRAEWLRERGFDDTYFTTFRKPDSSGLRCVGRWPWGPSWELCGRDSLLFLGSGSGVRILSISDSIHPRMLGQINARGLINQLVVQDTLLFVACGSWGAQIHSVSDPSDPRELGSMDATIGDLAVEDTWCYTVGGDSLRIYNVARPSQPTLTGAVRDSGNLVVVANGHAFSAGRWVMNIYNVTDPAHPVWANSRGGMHGNLFLRRNLLFCSVGGLSILDISNPLSITQVGRLDGYYGNGLYADDSFAYLSCIRDHKGLFVVDVSDSSRPVVHDSIDPEGVIEWAPFVPRPNSYGYLADDFGGLVTVDLHDVDDISEAWSGYKAHQAIDIVVDRNRAYVANTLSGLQIIDVSDPSDPVTQGLYDTVGPRNTYTATARDSFAFISRTGQPRYYFRVLDVSNPMQPVPVAQETCASWPLDLELRDSLCYAAATSRFFAFNVARPREPVLVGSCVSTDGNYFGLAVQDSFAYEVSLYGLWIINVARPDAPFVVSSNVSRNAAGVAVRDTFLYLPAGYDTVWVYSVADPAAPFIVGFTPMKCHLWDIALADSLAAVATVRGLDIVSLADPVHPEGFGGVTTPYGPRRVVYSAPYFYAAMWDAGVAVYETTTTGINERTSARLPNPKGIRAVPNPARSRVRLFGAAKPASVVVYDAAGRTAGIKAARNKGGDIELNIAGLKPGVYFVEVSDDSEVEVLRIVRP